MSRPGFWTSQLSAQRAAAGQVRYEAPQFAGGDLFWVESRPQQGGRNVLVRWDGRQPRDCLTAPYDVRSQVNAYGGGAWTAAPDGTLYFVNAADQGIYRRLPNGEVRLLLASRRRSFADLVLLRDGRLLAVCEEGGQRQYLVAIDSGGGMSRLHAGFDFYASPRPSPDGLSLAWICWNRPHMPWDNTELWLAEFGSAPWLHNPRRILGRASLQQPLWMPDGELRVISDASGWWSPHGLRGAPAPRLRPPADCANPPWVFGRHTHAVNEVGDYLFAARRQRGWSLYQRPATASRGLRLDAPFTEIESLCQSRSRIAVLAGTPQRALGVAVRDRAEAEWLWIAGGDSSAGEPTSVPRRLKSANGVQSLYYPPRNGHFSLGRGERPPLILKIHGGPTAASSMALDLRVQFWTSRGFAVLYVDYRGSSGYGRDFRDALYGHWGQADVEDCRDAARAAVRRGWADPSALFVSGSSAGGLTALNLLARTHDFAGAVSYYGVADLAALLRHSHRFECDYTQRLISAPSGLAKISRARSPLFHVERIRQPVLFIQGGRDKIVPRAQSRSMYDALRKKGIAAELLEFPEEGHGLRGEAAVAAALDAELAFYQHLLERVTKK